MNREQRSVRLECRGTRHWMMQAAPLADWCRPDSDTWARAFAILHFECQRPGCAVWRHDAVDSSFYLTARHYDYPDWYLMGEDERPTTEDLRRFMVDQQLKIEGRASRVRRAS